MIIKKMGMKNIAGFKYKTIIVWIDYNVHSSENDIYRKQKIIKEFQNFQFFLFENLNDGINFLKKLRYNPTYIILSGRYFFDFIDIYKANFDDFFIIPKILVFTGNKQNLKKYDKSNYFEHKFYNAGKVYDSVIDIITYFKNDVEFLNNLNIKEEKLPSNLNIFEFGENKKPFPNITNEDIDNLNKYLYLKSKFSSNLERLFIQLIGISEIPLQILIKYYIQAFNIKSQIFKNFNNEKNYYTFIKIFQDAISKNYISNDISNLNNSIYCSCLLHNNEIKSFIEHNKNNKNKIYLIKLLTFISSNNIANEYFNTSMIPINFSPVLFILDTNGLNDNKNFLNITQFKNNGNNKLKNYLFLPLSEFFITNIEEKTENNINKYIINLQISNKIKSNNIKKNENIENDLEEEFSIDEEESMYGLLEGNFIESLTCPITHQIMEDPVITKYGHTYERKEIENWIEKSGNDPLTKKPLTKNDIFPNFQLKNLIEEYKKMKKYKKNPLDK